MAMADKTAALVPEDDPLEPCGATSLRTPCGLIFRRSLLELWGFPKIRATLFWGPYNKDPTI